MAAMAATEKASGPNRPSAGVGGRPGVPEVGSEVGITALTAGEAEAEGGVKEGPAGVGGEPDPLSRKDPTA